VTGCCECGDKTSGPTATELVITAFWKRCVVLLKQTDVLEVRTAAIIRAIKAVRTSQTSVYSENTVRYVLEGCHLHTHRLENLKCHMYLRRM
jgi:hypothetical protein